ncbi:MAG: SMP-30/gluconolactonase/LRE family protein, partial [Cyclobacteriaceae bacterium]
AISRSDSFLIISSTDRMLNANSGQQEGGLYYVDLNTSEFKVKKLQSSWAGEFIPHGISMYKIQPGRYRILAINHANGNHSIEVFDLTGLQLVHIRSITEPMLISPNDLVLTSENRFYVTNDHRYTAGFGRVAEDYGGLRLSNVVYYNGSAFQEVASDIAYANGINYDRNRNLLYVASPRGFRINVYDVNDDGSLSLITHIPCNTGVDNLELDENGDIWTAGHPNLLKFTAYAAGKEEIAPSEVLQISYRDDGDYQVQQIYIEDGQQLSGSSVAVPFGQNVFVGSVMDDEILVLRR